MKMPLRHKFWFAIRVAGPDRAFEMALEMARDILLPIYERECPADTRPRWAMQVARLQWKGRIPLSEWDKARRAAQRAYFAAVDAGDDGDMTAGRMAFLLDILLYAMIGAAEHACNMAVDMATGDPWLTAQLSAHLEAFIRTLTIGKIYIVI